MLLYCAGVSWLQGMSGTFWLMPWQVPEPLATRPPPQVKTPTLAGSADPAPLAQLVVSCSFTVGGLVGVPLGVAALRLVDPKTLKMLLGLLLVGYTSVMLGYRRLPTVAWGGRVADGVVGFGGGILGGIAGLSGPLPTIWCGLRGWQADAQRGVYQPYNLTILSIALLAYATQGILTAQVGGFVLVCLPATLLGAYGGMRLYGRIDDRQFRYLVLWLLLASGLVLTVSNLL